MRVSDDTRYPHPVLSPDSGDYDAGQFEVDFICHEDAEGGRVRLTYKVRLTNEDILNLVGTGAARVGAIVQCRDTYYSQIQKMSWPEGQLDFVDGALLNRVYVRPIVWLTRPLDHWTPANVNSEFPLPLNLAVGDIIAIGLESRLIIGPAKLSPLESIFSLKPSDSLPTGSISVDPHGDKVVIWAGKDAFEAVSLVRGSSKIKKTVFAGVYLPALIDLLAQTSTANFDGRRWWKPFSARCDLLGINPKKPKILEDAQKLLKFPVVQLAIDDLTVV